MWQPRVWWSIVKRGAVPFISLYYLEGRCIKIPGKSRDETKHPNFFPNICLLCIVINSFSIALTTNYLRTREGTNWRAFISRTNFTLERTDMRDTVIWEKGRTDTLRQYNHWYLASLGNQAKITVKWTMCFFWNSEIW